MSGKPHSPPPPSPAAAWDPARRRGKSREQRSLGWDPGEGTLQGQPRAKCRAKAAGQEGAVGGQHQFQEARFLFLIGYFCLISSLGFICANFVRITIKYTQRQEIMKDVDKPFKNSILHFLLAVITLNLLVQLFACSSCPLCTP